MFFHNTFINLLIVIRLKNYFIFYFFSNFAHGFLEKKDENDKCLR